MYGGEIGKYNMKISYLKRLSNGNNEKVRKSLKRAWSVEERLNEVWTSRVLFEFQMH